MQQQQQEQLKVSNGISINSSSSWNKVFADKEECCCCCCWQQNVAAAPRHSNKLPLKVAAAAAASFCFYFFCSVILHYFDFYLKSTIFCVCVYVSKTVAAADADRLTKTLTKSGDLFYDCPHDLGLDIFALFCKLENSSWSVFKFIIFFNFLFAAMLKIKYSSLIDLIFRLLI